MTIYDISPLVSARSAVFPGDQPFRRDIALDFKRGDNLVLSAITTTVHVGAHADAPNHYHPDGAGIHQRDLARYLGPCQVVRLNDLAPDARIFPEHLAGVTLQAPRVLFATNSFPNPEQWQDAFNSFSPELIDMLADSGVVLAGIDTPSIDPAASKVLESHQQVYQRDLAVLENLVLTEVPDGMYFLSALPLRLEDADASPVRAVLVPLDQLTALE